MSIFTPISFDDTRIAFHSKTDSQLRKTHFVFATMNQPLLVKSGIFLTKTALKFRLPVKGLIRSTVFNQFCGGESIEDCSKTISHLGKFNVYTILDYSVEGQEDEKSFDQTLEESLHVADFAKDKPMIPFCVVKLTGLGSISLMTKVQAGEKLSEAENEQFARFKNRVELLAKKASENGLKFMIDAEESWIQDVIDRICIDLMIKYNHERPVVYNTYQFYRHAALANMKKAFKEVTDSGCYFGAKLVRGAYMEKERERAATLGYKDPIQANKAATDKDYNLAQEFIISNIDRFSMCSGTHNENSCMQLTQLMEKHNIARYDERVYFAQLLGMSDNISFKLSAESYNVAKYVPYGPVEKVMPYLIRRAEENTSIAGQSSREYLMVKKELSRRKKEKNN